MNDIYRYNTLAKYDPGHGGMNNQEKFDIRPPDLTRFKIVVKASGDGFKTEFQDFFKDYIIRRTGKTFDTWLHDSLSLWQTQINFFATYCATTACGISWQHLNGSKYPLVNAVFKFHIIYQIKRVLRRLGAALPTDNGFDKINNPWQKASYYTLCREFNVTSDYKWTNEYFSTSGGQGTDGEMRFLLDNDSYTRWVINTSQGLTSFGLKKLSESIRIYARLLLGSQVEGRASI